MATKNAMPSYDYMLLIPALLLMTLGLVAVYSASSHAAALRFGDSYFFLKKQLLFCALGLGAMLAARHIPCALYRKMVYPLLFVSLGLLVLLFVPGFGHKVAGATRWLRWGPFSMQPSEVAKFSLAVYMAYSMSSKGSSMETLSKGLVPHIVVAGAFMTLMMLQPDLGTAVIIGFWMLVLLYVGGAKVIQLVSLMALFTPVVLWLVWRSEYRLKRWLAFINPWDDPSGIGFQIVHSFMAFGSGGFFGAGIGGSRQKLFYLPEAHTDFILSVVAEELGFFGVGITIILFGMLIVRGIRVSLDARDLYSSYLAFGLTCLLGLQVLVNMGVVMGLLPTKGLSLPFVSYGGSSLLMNLAIIGVLLSISSRS